MPVNEVQIIEIPCGMGGLNSSEIIGEYPVEDLRYAENLTYEDDTWRKEGGASKINSVAITSTPIIVGLWDFWPSSGTQKRIAATSDGKIVSFDSGGIVDTLVSGLGSDKQTVFVEAYGSSSTRKLFSFNGYDPVKVTSDGVTGSTISKPPADWSGTNQPIAGVSHNGRLWAWGNSNAPNRVYYSLLDDHENFQDTGSGTLQIYPGEGEKIVAGFSFAGRLYLFKYPRGIYWIDDSSTTITDWKAKRLTFSMGMAGPLGLTQIDNDVVFVSNEGYVHALSTVQEFGDAKASAIFPEKIGNYIRNNFLMSRLSKAVAVYYSSKKEWQLAFTQSGYTYNNRRLVLDFHNMQLPRYRFSTRDVCEAMALTRDSNSIYKPMIGDNAGFIWLLDQSSRNKGGSAYIGKFETSDISINPKGARMANLQYIEVVYKPMGDHNLTVDVYRDGIYSETVLINMGGQVGGKLGSFLLGTDVLGGGTVLNTRKRLLGDCRRVKLVGYNSGLNEDFSISTILIGYTVGNERVG